MTGREHYVAAERLLANVAEHGGPVTQAYIKIATAQVHATLALAAFTEHPVVKEAR